MIPDYINELPIPQALLPPRLRALLEPAGDGPQLRVEVSSRYEIDAHGPKRECAHMIMALAPTLGPGLFRAIRETGDGVVFFSTPHIDARGGLARFEPSISGLDYIVASRGDGSFYTYDLAEKVWMALGLSMRCVGGDQQRLIYDDLSLPEFGVAEGEISTEYYYAQKRDVRWTMSNEYLRRYLWMRGSHGVRAFYYQTLLPDVPELRALMADAAHAKLAPEDGWYELDLRENNGGLLLQLWAAVVAVSPDLSPEQSAEELIWPGVAGKMTHDRANALTDGMPVYLDDRFLERYEQNGLFDTMPFNTYGQWYCSPSYGGQWSFSDCRRVGRNLIKVPMRELYKPKPDREILHAHAHVVDPARLTEFDLEEEHIAAKTQRLLDQLLDLGENLAALSDFLGSPMPAVEIVKFSHAELRANGWMAYPELSRIAQVAPLGMTQQAFLSRCKSVYELWQRIPNGFLRCLTERAGHKREDLKKANLGSGKLLQALSNIAERLNAEGDRADAFGTAPEPGDLTNRNPALAPLFVNNDLRIADAHDAGGVFRSLEALGFDVAALNQGYGRALDHVLDGVIGSFGHLNTHLAQLLDR